MKYQIFAALAEDAHAGWIWIGKPNLPIRTIVHLTCIDTGKKVWCESLPIDKNFLRRYNERATWHIIRDKREKKERLTTLDPTRDSLGQPFRWRIHQPNSSLVISGWYRKLLGDVQARHEVEIRIEPCDNLYGRLRSSLQHPDNVVRLATWLGLISLGLGSLGAVLGFIGLFG